MHSTGSGALILAALFANPALLEAQVTGTDSAEVRTIGTAERSVRPDRATLSLEFSVIDSTPAKAGARLAVRADSVRGALVGLGVPRDSLVTGSRWYWWPRRIEVLPHSRCVRLPDPQRGCEQVVDTTYRARENIQVLTRDITQVGRIIDTALALGITEISNLTFVATDTRAAQEEALREATLHARQQAIAIAAASGGRLGRVLSLSTQPDYSSRFSGFSEIITSGMETSRPGTEITAPAVTVRVTVHGRWRLLGK